MLRAIAILAVLVAWPFTIGDGWQAPLPPFTPRATKIAVGYGYACALMTDRTVRCWGSVPAELGGSRRIAEPIDGFTDVVDVRMWGYHTCFIRASGERKCWGVTGDPPPSACTLNGSVVRCRTVDRDGHVDVLTDASDLVNGLTFSCALRRDRTVWCWGSNFDKILGDEAVKTATAPVRVAGLDDVVQLVAGSSHVCARRAAGDVACWGNEPRIVISPRPLPIAGLDPAIQLETTRSIACVLSAEGQIACWGDGYVGAVGDGRSRTSTTPVAVRWTPLHPTSRGLPAGVHAVTVATRNASTCALLDDGTVRCWGAIPDDTLQPTALWGVRDVVRLDVADAFSAVERDGSLLRWGDVLPPRYDGRGLAHFDGASQFDCRLGLDHAAACADTHGPARLPHVVALASRGFGGCALREDRSVWCFTPGSGGWLHQALLDGARQLVLSERNVCMLADDRVRCFTSSRPTEIPGLVDIDYLATLQSVVCAHARSGRVSCWSGNETPTERPEMFGATSISGTNDHTCAVLAGDVQCWGNNDHGQLGDGTTERHDAPRSVVW